MPIDGVAAARKMQGFNLGNRTGMCLYWVWQAYDQVGADTHLQAGTAMRAWELTDGKHPGDRNPPAGAAVWWGRRRSDGNRDGDVVISLGGGRVVATDQPVWGKVGTCTIAEREALIDREYLGWTDHIFDVPISLPTIASTGAEPVSDNGSEFDMSQLTRVRRVFKKQKIGSKYSTLHIREHAVSVASAVNVIGGTIQLEISTDKHSSVPDVFQLRPVIATVKNGKSTSRSNGPHQIVEAAGTTRVQVPVPPIELGPDERLRFQIKALGGRSGTLVSATYRGQHLA